MMVYNILACMWQLCVHVVYSYMHILKEGASESRWEGKDSVVILYIYRRKGPVGGERRCYCFIYLYICRNRPGGSRLEGGDGEFFTFLL